MQFKASFVAAFLLATTPALGFTVPKDTQDGAYTVQRDNSGREVHTRADDVSSEAAVSRAIRSSHVKRDGLDEIDCFRDQEALVHDDVANAVRELRNQIGSGGSGLGSHKGLYSIVGDVVAYCCNNRSQGNTCYLSAQQESNTLITEKCGEDSPGYAYDSGAHLTYGYQHKSHDFCPGDDDDEACNPIEACEVQNSRSLLRFTVHLTNGVVGQRRWRRLLLPFSRLHWRRI